MNGTPVSRSVAASRASRIRRRESAEGSDLASGAVCRHRQPVTAQAARSAGVSAPLQLAHDAIRQAGISAARLSPGTFRLAAPAGGGKTLSAMDSALWHALQHGHQRIIVVVPFISITEQTTRRQGVRPRPPDLSLIGVVPETRGEGVRCLRPLPPPIEPLPSDPAACDARGGGYRGCRDDEECAAFGMACASYETSGQ